MKRKTMPNFDLNFILALFFRDNRNLSSGQGSLLSPASIFTFSGEYYGSRGLAAGYF